MTAEIIQKRGFYAITTEAGGKARLDRVTGTLDWVLKDGMGPMSYYGGKLFAKWLADPGVGWEDEWIAMYTAWKESPFDPNAVLRVRGDEGTASHALFQKLIEGTALIRTEATSEGVEYWVDDGEIEFIAKGYDRGVVEAFLEVYDGMNLHIQAVGRASKPLSEVSLYWTEHPIDECPSHDKQGRCTHGFSGRCDVYYPHFGLDDLKTHVPGYRFSEWVQMAMYGLAAEQMYPEAKITRQRIILAHEEPGEDGKYYELQDDRFLSPEAGRLLWELYKLRKEWGPKK